MFLEKCGQFFFLRMRPPLFFALAVLPLAFASLYLSQINARLHELESRFAGAARKERLALERKERKERFLQRHSSPNPYFLDQEIESFPLLQHERHALESLLHHPAFPESLPIKERIAFLDKNRLLFSEEGIAVSEQMKEVEEKQRYPVQMDENDLKRILSLIEDVPIDSFTPLSESPQILIKEFHLKKQETSLHTEVFEVEMTLLKREFFQP
ncbi:MAG: hypothetical protein WCF19_06230 [Chlamydiales bacterium]